MTTTKIKPSIPVLKFRNVMAIMCNLDLSDLEAAGIIKPNQSGGGDWDRWNRDPLMFVLKTTDEKLNLLWDLIESRQPQRYRGEGN